MAAHESVLEGVSLKAFHRVPQLVCLDTVVLQIVDVDIIGFRADIKHGRRVYRQFQPFVLIVELYQRLFRSLPGVGQIVVLVGYDPQQNAEQVWIDQRQAHDFKTVGKCREIWHTSGFLVEQRGVERKEERRYQHFSEAPDRIMPPSERNILVEERENKPCQGQYTDHNAGQHQQMECPRFSSDVVKIRQRERIIDKAKHEEEQRHQHRVFYLAGVAFRDPQWCVHSLKTCPNPVKTVP